MDIMDVDNMDMWIWITWICGYYEHEYGYGYVDIDVDVDVDMDVVYCLRVLGETA